MNRFLMIMNLMLFASPSFAEGEESLAKCLRDKNFVLYGKTTSKKALENIATKNQLEKFASSAKELNYIECTNTDELCKIIKVYPTWFKDGKPFVSGSLPLHKLNSLSGCNIASIKQPTSFRNTNWGDSKAKVKQQEKQPLVYERDDYLQYTDTLFNLKWKVVYIFVDDKLVRSKYFLDEKFSNNDTYINTYLESGKQLKEKYGDAIEAKAPVRVSPWGDDIGNSIAFGYTSSWVEWRLPDIDTIINMAIYGNQGTTNLSIEYSSISLKSLETKNTTKENQSKL